MYTSQFHSYADFLNYENELSMSIEVHHIYQRLTLAYPYAASNNVDIYSQESISLTLVNKERESNQ